MKIALALCTLLALFTAGPMAAQAVVGDAAKAAQKASADLQASVTAL